MFLSNIKYAVFVFYLLLVEQAPFLQREGNVSTIILGYGSQPQKLVVRAGIFVS
jgi:hypothetical protein